MYPAIRTLLFQLDPERAHALNLSLLRFAGRMPPVAALLRSMFVCPPRPVDVFGLQFTNPVGLAAGYDKDGIAWLGLACLGFGHIEVGTVTPRAQVGNPQPRLFRLPEEKALINRMGFPGRGADYVSGQLIAPRPAGLILGVNLGKNKDTPLEDAAEDYLSLMKTFAPLADYLAINVSSPNTIGLRRLQARQALGELLGRLEAERRNLSASLSRKVPILVKLAPDLTEDELNDALEVILGSGVDGVIASNTTLSRDGVRSARGSEAGGLSGAPLRAKSTQMIRAIYARTKGDLPIVGVGGVMSPEHAREKLEAGASLVQVYTGLVYAGPALVKSIVTAL